MSTVRGKSARPVAGSEDEAAISYDHDYFAWTQAQAELLRRGDWTRPDVANLVDEVETLGRSEKREIESQLQVLLVHHLKWFFQPSGRSSGWRGTIFEQRTRIAKDLKDSPSLRAFPGKILAQEDVIARLKAARETGLPEETFPADCPFTIAEVLKERFFSDGE